MSCGSAVPGVIRRGVNVPPVQPTNDPLPPYVKITGASSFYPLPVHKSCVHGFITIMSALMACSFQNRARSMGQKDYLAVRGTFCPPPFPHHSLRMPLCTPPIVKLCARRIPVPAVHVRTSDNVWVTLGGLRGTNTGNRKSGCLGQHPPPQFFHSPHG